MTAPSAGVWTNHAVSRLPSSALPATPVRVARRYGSYIEPARGPSVMATGAFGAGVVVGVDGAGAGALDGGGVGAAVEVAVEVGVGGGDDADVEVDVDVVVFGVTALGFGVAVDVVGTSTVGTSPVLVSGEGVSVVEAPPGAVEPGATVAAGGGTWATCPDVAVWAGAGPASRSAA